VKKFHILARPIRYWSETIIKNIVYNCIILHNMCCEERVKKGIA
jgi:Plant transposon protein